MSENNVLEQLTARVAHLKNLVEHLISEARTNNRIAIVAIYVIAGGKEVISFLK